MKLETSRNVTKSKRILHWCRSISKKYLCTFYYSISQKVITLSGRRFITVSGGCITLSGSYYSIGRLLHYRLVQYCTAAMQHARHKHSQKPTCAVTTFCHHIIGAIISLLNLRRRKLASVWSANGPVSCFVVVCTKCLPLPAVYLVPPAPKEREQCDLAF